MKFIPLLILLLSGHQSPGQQAGYRTIVLTDSGRHYKPGVGPDARLYYRPVEIDVWYPAEANAARPIPYGAFLELFEQRANRFQDDTIYSNLPGEMARYFAAGFGIADTASLLGLATQSYWNANPARGRFPLIVYLCSYNGMCYENTRLFEMLARRGYIVASITSVGRYPGNMTTGLADLQEQVADGLFAVNVLRKSGTIDTAKIGLIGYSWGGPAALLLAQDLPVAAVLSLDGSELHYYFESGGEDSNFDLIRQRLLRPDGPIFPYAYLESDGKQSEGPADSIFNILPTFKGPKKFIRFAGTRHEDFSCLPFLAAMIRRSDLAALPDYPAFAVKWFDNYLKGVSDPLPGDSPYPVVSNRLAHATTIGAKVLDAEDKSPLAYVNVGIPGKNVGTVTGGDGGFRLDLDTQLANDSLAVSMVGYEKQVLALKHLPGVILLRRKTGGLTAAVVTSGIRGEKVYGNTTRSNFVSVGFPTRFLGAEMGVKMPLGRNPRHLKKFQCHVSNTRVDSAVFRVNIYRVVNGIPVNILPRNVLLSIGNSPGDYAADLSDLNLVLSGDILVSLELLRAYSPAGNPGAVFFSAAFFHSGTWRRQTSQADWKKARGIGVGFTIEAR